MDDEEKHESEEEEKSEHSDFKMLVEKLRKDGHTDTEIVNTLLALADKGKVELEKGDEKKVGDESQEDYDYHEDEKNYDEGYEAGKKKLEEMLHHKI